MFELPGSFDVPNSCWEWYRRWLEYGAYRKSTGSLGLGRRRRPLPLDIISTGGASFGILSDFVGEVAERGCEARLDGKISDLAGDICASLE